MFDRKMLGMFIALIGLALTPLAWAFIHALWVVCIMLSGVGGYLFFTARARYKVKKIDKDDGCSTYSSALIQTDMFDYTGRRSGEHRENRSTDLDFDGGGGD